MGLQTGNCKKSLILHATVNVMKHLLLSTACCIFFVLNTFSQQRVNDTTILTSDSVQLYLKVSGKGTPCIFVHGGPGAWSRSFEAMGGNRLEEKLTMYYFDQRGSGRSKAATNEDYSLDRLVKDIENIRSLTGSEQVYLVAHSFGGIPAFKYAEKYPQHVKGLILLNATLYIYNSLISQVNFINNLYGSHISVANKDSLMQSFFAAKKIMREHKEDYKMLSDNKATVEKLDSIDNAPRDWTFAQRAFGIPDYLKDYTGETAKVKVPVLVITGTNDHNIGPDHYKLFHFPHQQVKVIKGGHVLYYEKNDDFANAVFGFIK